MPLNTSRSSTPSSTWQPSNWDTCGSGVRGQRRETRHAALAAVEV
jgi:hypothetical protein